MTFELSKESKRHIKSAKGEFGKASLALVTAASGVALALQVERINALSTPAAQRPKLSEIKEVIRAEFGGLEKEGNRQAYDLCSLAFRVLDKANKEAEAIVSEGVMKGAVWFRDQISALAGRKTVDAWKAWVTGEKASAKVEKSAGEKLLAYFEKNGGDVEKADLDKLAEMVLAELQRRESQAQLAAELAEAS